MSLSAAVARCTSMSVKAYHDTDGRGLAGVRSGEPRFCWGGMLLARVSLALSISLSLSVRTYI